MIKPCSMARFIAQPPMPRTMTYMQKLRARSNDATDLNWVLAISEKLIEIRKNQGRSGIIREVYMCFLKEREVYKCDCKEGFGSFLAKAAGSKCFYHYLCGAVKGIKLHVQGKTTKTQILSLPS